MQRVDAPEILDSDACSPADVEATLLDLGRVNRWFGGVATTQKMVERAAKAAGLKHFSLLEVAAGTGEVPEMVRQRLARRGITLDVTLLDRATISSSQRKPWRCRRCARPAFRRWRVRSCELQPFCPSSQRAATGAVCARGSAGEPAGAADQRPGSPSCASGSGVCRLSPSCAAGWPGWTG